MRERLADVTVRSLSQGGAAELQSRSWFSKSWLPLWLGGRQLLEANEWFSGTRDSCVRSLRLGPGLPRSGASAVGEQVWRL